MNKEYDISIFDGGVHYIRLGYMIATADGYNLTVGDRAGGTPKGLSLTAQYFDLLVSLDPTVSDRNFTAEEQGLLWWMAREGYVALVGADGALRDFDIVAVSRKNLQLVEELEQGYRVRTESGQPFKVSELGYRFLPDMDGHRSLDEIGETVLRNTFAHVGDRENALQFEAASGRSFESYLVMELLQLIKDLTTSGAMTFEPAQR